jgi:hypothetical protein
MKKAALVLFTLMLTLTWTSCEEFTDITDVLTNAEVIEGLRSALTVGTDTSVTTVSALNGYYQDALIKILLPPEAEIIQSYLTLIPFGDQLWEETVMRINRAAEDAATEAKPIFLNAITGMTIDDGWAILNGEDTAATGYLIEKTYTDLSTLFQPKIKTSLDKPLIGGVSTNESWGSLTTYYNDLVVNTLVGQLAGLTEVNSELDGYVTERALNGLFIKVADEEKAIRTDPLARVNDILDKVFSSLDE